MSISDIKRCPNCHKIVSAYSVCPICGFTGLHKLNNNDKIDSSQRTNEMIEQENKENNSNYIPVDTYDTKSNKPSVLTIIFIILGVFVGILFIVMGLSTINSADISRFESGLLNYKLGHLVEAEFGADFYTYTYEGIFEVERDLCYLGQAIVKLIKAVGMVISGIGVVITLKSLFKASEIRLHR